MISKCFIINNRKGDKSNVNYQIINRSNDLPSEITNFFLKLTNYIKGDLRENNLIQGGIKKINIEEIIELIPLIENFVFEFGNKFLDLEDKFNFVENNNFKLNDLISSEKLKLKKANEAIDELKVENKCLK